jgi:hypothetical protein
MPTPNLINLKTVLGKTTFNSNITSTASTVLQNTLQTDASIKLNSLLICNTGSANANVTIMFYDAGLNACTVLFSNINVPPGRPTTVINRNGYIYLSENDILSACSSVTSNIQALASYEIISANVPYSTSTLDTVSLEYLVVAGGGAGGGGGGGAGGFRTGTLTGLPSATLTVLVGSGGANNSAYNTGTICAGSSGTPSCFASICSTGGGGGGGYAPGGFFNTANATPKTGGSGGGGIGHAAYPEPTYPYGALGNIPATVPSQGNKGGNGFIQPSAYGTWGGGGGAGADGNNGIAGSGGAGGVGRYSTISGSNVAYSGGGGGGGHSSGNNLGGAGGAGGGGQGGQASNTPSWSGYDATVNSGGGGGGAGAINPTYGNSGKGGSGVVIIRYPGPAIATGGDIRTEGSNTIHTYNSTSTFALTSGVVYTPTNDVNIANVRSLYQRTDAFSVSGSEVFLFGNRNTSNAVFKINSIKFDNTTNSNSTIAVSLYDYDTSSRVYLVSNTLLTGNTSYSLVDENSYIYLEQNQALFANSTVATTLSINYDIITERNIGPNDVANLYIQIIEYLVVAGGGGGGGHSGGGGGAGGLLTSVIIPNTGTTPYQVIVGGGGPGGAGGTNGSNSQILVSNVAIVNSIGGGAGFGVSTPGNPGGSGGGGGGRGDTGVPNPTGSGGPGTPGQGFPGGAGAAPADVGGAGGGAGGAGQSAGAGGAGGPGAYSSISGANVAYAGGGGGSSTGPTTGGVGGGGPGGLSSGTAGTAFTGGGGGGARQGGTSGAPGGSGIVILRYRGAQRATGGNTIVTANGYTTHTFNSSNNFVFSN